MDDLFLDGLPQAPSPAIRSIGACVRGAQVPLETVDGFERLHPDLQRRLQGASIFDAGDPDGYDLCLGAAEEAISRAGIEAQDLDFIVHVSSRVPSAFLTSEVGRLQNDLGARHATGLSLSGLGCADTSMALKLAWDHLRANPHSRNALVAYGHVRYAASRIRLPVTVNGDGAGAVVVGREAGSADIAILGVEQMLNGDYWNLFAIHHAQTHGTEYAEVCLDERRYGFELAVESKNRFEMLSSRLEERVGYGLRSVDHLVLQNLSPQAYEFYEAAFGIRFSPVCLANLRQYGHLGGADIFLNLRAGIEAGAFGRGETVLLMNNSPAAAWSLILLRI